MSALGNIIGLNYMTKTDSCYSAMTNYQSEYPISEKNYAPFHLQYFFATKCGHNNLAKHKFYTFVNKKKRSLFAVLGIKAFKKLHLVVT